MKLTTATQPNHEVKERTDLFTPTPQLEVEEIQAPTFQKEYQKSPFLEANTKSIKLTSLRSDCIIPVFAKDNERTIAHQEFIETTNECVNEVFNHHAISMPEIRVSHQIKGRIPEAIHKPAKELLDFEKTQYFERMAFVIRLPSIVETINENPLSLMVGGVRAYNKENLHSRKSLEKFQVFIGFQNMVCCNLCISTDGFSEEIRVGNCFDLKEKITDLLQTYNMENHIHNMQELPQHSLTETQFAQLIGRSRLYQYLPKKEKKHLPELLLNDGQINSITKDYYNDESFSRNEKGYINLWNLYNLFTSSVKSSYIDTFLDRNANSYEFLVGLKKALSGDSCHSWFLS